MMRMDEAERAESEEVELGEFWADRLRAAVEIKMTGKVPSRAWPIQKAPNKCCFFSARSPSPPTRKGTERSVSPGLVWYIPCLDLCVARIVSQFMFVE